MPAKEVTSGAPGLQGRRDGRCARWFTAMSRPTAGHRWEKRGKLVPAKAESCSILLNERVDPKQAYPKLPSRRTLTYSCRGARGSGPRKVVSNSLRSR